MKRERRVLQDGIEAAAVDRRRLEAKERIRGRENEEEEGERDRSLDREHARLERRRKIAAENGDGGAEQRQDQHPEQHRALVVAPHARDPIEERLRRVRVLGDVGDREVGADVGLGQREEGERDERELAHRRGLGKVHEALIAHARAVGRDHHLRGGDGKRQNECEMSELDDH